MVSLNPVYLFSQPQYMPCARCGASVAQAEAQEHTCDPERWLAYNMFQLRSEIALFGAELDAYLQSARGRFEVWYAARRRTSRD